MEVQLKLCLQSFLTKINFTFDKIKTKHSFPRVKGSKTNEKFETMYYYYLLKLAEQMSTTEKLFARFLH